MANITEQLGRATIVPRTDIFRRTQSYTGRIPMSTTRTSSGIGAATLRLPTERSIGLSIPLAPATASAFGGVSGGMGAAAPSVVPISPTTITNFGSSVGKAGTGIMNTFGTIIPLAIKVVAAVIVIKIVLWLIKGRRR